MMHPTHTLNNVIFVSNHHHTIYIFSFAHLISPFIYISMKHCTSKTPPTTTKPNIVFFSLFREPVCRGLTEWKCDAIGLIIILLPFVKKITMFSSLLCDTRWQSDKPVSFIFFWYVYTHEMCVGARKKKPARSENSRQYYLLFCRSWWC